MYMQYHVDANDGESWIKEREPLATSDDFGTSEASAKVTVEKNLDHQLLVFTCISNHRTGSVTEP